MRNESWSIGFACALGAFIGGLIAQSLGGQYLWTGGAVIGGIVAYIAIDFKQFCAGAARAYRKTAAWQPDKLFWKAFGAEFVMASACCATLLSIALSMVTFIEYGQGRLESEMLAISAYMLIVWFVASLVATLLFASENLRRDSEVPFVYENRLHDNIETNLTIARYCNPMSAFYWTCYFVVWLIRRSPAGISASAKFLGQFTYATFVYVHSARRTICFVDASIGTAIGFMCSDGLTGVLIGTVVGALLGVANYEIVSIRWLKLVPTR